MAHKHFSFFCRLKFQILVYFLRNNYDLFLHLLKKSPPLFQQPPSKNWDPARPPFLKIWYATQAPGRKGDAHYVSGSLLKKMFNVLLRSHLTFFGTSGHIKPHEE